METSSSFRAKVDRDKSRCWYLGKIHYIEEGLAEADFPLYPGREHVTFELITLEQDMQLSEVRRLVRKREVLFPDLAETQAFYRAHPQARLAPVVSLCGRCSKRGKKTPHMLERSGISYAVARSRLSLFWRELNIPFFERDRLLVVRRR